MSDKVTFVSIGTVDPDQADALSTYATHAPPLLIEAGAVPRMKAKLVEELVGDGAPQTVFIADFPNAEAVHEVFASDAYRALVPARDKAFKKLNFFLVEDF
ncbi:MAG: DUF1330 domain-containing protein [Pseudomonadota bacterium]